MCKEKNLHKEIHQDINSDYLLSNRTAVVVVIDFDYL